MGRVLRAARWGVLLLGVLGVAWCGGIGPYGALPGGWLWGEVKPPPSDWSFTDGIKEIQVETRLLGLPYAVTTWVLSYRGDLFIAAGLCDRVWVNRVKARPEIRLRVGGAVYEMRAEVTTDREIGAGIAPVLLHKYFGIAVDAANFDRERTSGCVFRVEPRS